MIELKIRTWVEQDEDDGKWYCHVAFWGKTQPPNEQDEPDHHIRVGSWDTEERAQEELTGKFRERVMTAVSTFAKGAMFEFTSPDDWPTAS